MKSLPEEKVCPLLMIGRPVNTKKSSKAFLCLKEKCAWWTGMQCTVARVTDVIPF
ncbi:MAG: hypothetical protein ACXAAP_16235 [Candidatus Thorarchaeota archaeon]